MLPRSNIPFTQMLFTWYHVALTASLFVNLGKKKTSAKYVLDLSKVICIYIYRSTSLSLLSFTKQEEICWPGTNLDS